MECSAILVSLAVIIVTHFPLTLGAAKLFGQLWVADHWRKHRVPLRQAGKVRRWQDAEYLPDLFKTKILARTILFKTKILARRSSTFPSVTGCGNTRRTYSRPKSWREDRCSLRRQGAQDPLLQWPQVLRLLPPPPHAALLPLLPAPAASCRNEMPPRATCARWTPSRCCSSLKP